MPVEFYYHPFSPPSRSAWMVLEELGIEYTPIYVDLFKGEHKKESYKLINKRQRVPTIKDGKTSVAESRAVAMYLANQYAAKKGREDFYPTDPAKRAAVDQQLFVDENLVDKIISYINPGGILFRGEGRHKTENLPALREALQYYDDLLSEHEYIALDNLTIADIFAFSAVKFITVTPFEDFGDFPNLQRWLKVMEARPYYEKTLKEPLTKQAAFFKQKIDEAQSKKE